MVSAGNRLLAIFSVKLISFIRSNDVRITYSSQIISKYSHLLAKLQ